MSEEFYGKSIPITSGFDLGAKSPLDTRSIVNTIEERNAHVTGNRVYEGMKVYVLAEKKEYRYNGNDWEEIGGTTEVSQGETEPTEESVLLWIDTTSNENMVENNLSNSLITEFQGSISTLNTRVSTLEKNIEPPFGEDAHTHSNKVVLDKITQAYFDKWNNKSDFNGSYNSLTDKPNLDIYATRTYVDTAIESMGNQNLDDYALKSELPTKTSDLTNDSGYLTSIPSEYITEVELESKGYLTEHQDVSNLATKNELNSKANLSDIPTQVSELTNDSNFATETFVTTKISEASLSGGGSSFSGSYNDLTDKPTIPTKTSDLTNDSGYLTSIPSEYITETELTSMGYATETYVNTAISNLSADAILPITKGGTGSTTPFGALNSLYQSFSTSAFSTNGILYYNFVTIVIKEAWDSCSFECNIVESAKNSMEGKFKVNIKCNDIGILYATSSWYSLNNSDYKENIIISTSSTGFPYTFNIYLKRMPVNTDAHIFTMNFSNLIVKYSPSITINKNNNIVSSISNVYSVSSYFNDVTNSVSSKGISTTSLADGGNADTVGGYAIWVGTQAEYDAIGSKNSTTIYFIKG